MLDQGTVNDFINGNHQSFDQVYRVYGKSIWSFCYKFTRSAEVSEELTHDIFLRVWEKRSTIKSVTVEGFLFKVARNLIFDWLRRKAVENQMKSELIIRHTDEQENIQPQIQLQSHIDLDTVKKVIDAFPPKRKQVFELCKFSEMTYSEVSKQLLITKDTVKDHMMKANKALTKLNQTGNFTLPLFLIFGVSLIF